MFLLFKIFVQGNWRDFINHGNFPSNWEVVNYGDGYVIDVYSTLSEEDISKQRGIYRTEFCNFIDKYNHLIINTLFKNGQKHS